MHKNKRTPPVKTSECYLPAVKHHLCKQHLGIMGGQCSECSQIQNGQKRLYRTSFLLYQSSRIDRGAINVIKKKIQMHLRVSLKAAEKLICYKNTEHYPSMQVHFSFSSVVHFCMSQISGATNVLF